MDWLNDGWYALKVDTVDCGKLFVPTGRLLICDPLCYLDSEDLTVGIRIQIPAGEYSVKLSDELGVGIVYASLIISDKTETVRKQFLDMPEAVIPENIDRSSDFIGVPVETGTVCFVDEGALEYGMPSDKKLWRKQVIFFDGADEIIRRKTASSPFSWENIRAKQAMEQSIIEQRERGNELDAAQREYEEVKKRAWDEAITESQESDKESTEYLSGEEHWNYLFKNNELPYINTQLPLAFDGANIIMMDKFGGDGYYPVAGGYDAEGNLVAVHIVLYDPRGSDDED